MYDDIDGTVIVTRDNETGVLSYEWQGGDTIGISLQLLLDCDRNELRWKGELLPVLEERIEIGPYVVTAKEWRGRENGSWTSGFLVCTRDLIDSEEG